MKKILIRISLCQKGATAIEYALIIAGVGLTISTGVFLFSDQVIALFVTIGNAINDRF